MPASVTPFPLITARAKVLKLSSSAKPGKAAEAVSSWLLQPNQE